MNFRRMMGKMGLRLSKNKFTHKRILSSDSLLSHCSSCGHNFTYVWHIGLNFCTHLDKSCSYHVSKYYIDIHHTFFWDTRYVKANVHCMHYQLYYFCVTWDLSWFKMWKFILWRKELLHTKNVQLVFEIKIRVHIHCLCSMSGHFKLSLMYWGWFHTTLTLKHIILSTHNFTTSYVYLKFTTCL